MWWWSDFCYCFWGRFFILILGRDPFLILSRDPFLSFDGDSFLSFEGGSSWIGPISMRLGDSDIFLFFYPLIILIYSRYVAYFLSFWVFVHRIPFFTQNKMKNVLKKGENPHFCGWDYKICHYTPNSHKSPSILPNLLNHAEKIQHYLVTTNTPYAYAYEVLNNIYNLIIQYLKNREPNIL